MYGCYYTFSWTPPELSTMERIGLGQAISAVGREAFSKALKNRLFNTRYKNTKWTLADVYNDIQYPEAPPSTKQKLVLGALGIGAGAVFLAIGAPVLIPLALCGSVTGASYWWAARKVDKWVQSIVDDYASSTIRAVGGKEIKYQEVVTVPCSYSYTFEQFKRVMTENWGLSTEERELRNKGKMLQSSEGLFSLQDVYNRLKGSARPS